MSLDDAFVDQILQKKFAVSESDRYICIFNLIICNAKMLCNLCMRLSKHEN